MCQLAMYGVAGSNTCHASLTNSLKLRAHRARTDGTLLSVARLLWSLSLRLKASLTCFLVTRSANDPTKLM
jgi:hypothetical protein